MRPINKQFLGCRILLSEIFQVLLQFLAGKEDAALYCSKWEVQLFCDFTVLETGDMHGERYLVLTWQGIDNAVHFLQVVGAFCAVECEVVRRVQMIEIVCGIYKMSGHVPLYGNC